MKKYLLLIFFVLVALGAVWGVLKLGEKVGLDLASGIEDAFNDLKPDKKQESTQKEQDTRPLSLTYNNAQRSIHESQHAFTIQANKEVELSGNDRVTLFFIKESNGSFYYVAEINNLAIGDTTLKFELKDQVGNSEEVVVPITRINLTLPNGEDKIVDWEGSVYMIVDSQPPLLLIDKTHKLVDDYAPQELVDVKNDLQLYANVEGIKVEKTAGSNLRNMLLDLRNAVGTNAVVVSGYRAFNDQVKTYTNNVRAYGLEQANTFSAKPGFSDHQLGTVVDLYTSETGDELFSDNFDNTVVGQWLKANCFKYGFVQATPQGGEGIKYEPWQYRYVGLENAQKVQESGKSFEEWTKTVDSNQ